MAVPFGAKIVVEFFEAEWRRSGMEGLESGSRRGL